MLDRRQRIGFALVLTAVIAAAAGVGIAWNVLGTDEFVRRINFGYDANYLPTCQHYAVRKQTSWDFMVCEAARGWPASHITSPFAVYLFFGNFWIAWLVPGIFEGFEAITLTVFNDFIVFQTTDIDRETLSGSIIGDWLLCGTAGVLAGWLICYVFDVPPLLPDWYWRRAYRGWRAGGNVPEWYLESERKMTKTRDFLGQPQVPRRKEETELVLTPAGLPENVDYAIVWWRQLFFWFFFGVAPIGVTWVLPRNCVFDVPNSCLNVGLMLSTGLTLFLFALIFWVMYRTAELSQRYVLHGYPWRRLAAFFAVSWLFVFSVHVQNWQSFVPMYLGVAGGFTQPLLVSGLWIATLWLGFYVPNAWPRWRKGLASGLRTFKKSWRVFFWCCGFPTDPT